MTTVTALKADTETTKKFVQEKHKLHPQRAAMWKKRTKRMKEFGIAVHGGEEGFWVDMIEMFCSRKNTARLDALLLEDAVKERYHIFNLIPTHSTNF